MGKSKLIIIFALLFVIAFSSCKDVGTNSNALPDNPEVSSVSADELKAELNIELANELYAEINSYISNKSGTWSVYVKNLDTGMCVEINDKEFKAASTIKLFNMITFYDEVNKGNIKMNDILYRTVELMITESSNTDSNTIVTEIGDGDFFRGAKRVGEFSRELGCSYTREEHMLFDTLVYAPGRNRTSVKDCGLVLEKLYKKECISPEYDEEMMNFLKAQTVNWKIPAYLPDGTVIAHKTGENSSVQADVGIVFAPACDYIICIAVTDFGDAPAIHNVAQVSKIVYDFFERTADAYDFDAIAKYLNVTDRTDEWITIEKDAKM